MADNIIGIKFGVAGGKGFQAGSSGALIKEQLEYIASRISLKVNVNKTYFKNQLSSLKKELDKTLGSLNIKIRANVKPEIEGGGGSSGGEEPKKQVANYEAVIKTLERLYQIKTQISKLSDAEKTGTIKGVTLSRQADALKEQYEEQLSNLRKMSDVDEQRIQSIVEFRDRLEEAFRLQQQMAAQASSNVATPIAAAKINVKAQSLYTDNGFDKIIARSKEATQLVDEFNIKVQQALNQPDGITKDEISALNKEFLNIQARLKEIGRETDTTGNKIREAFDSRVIQRIAQVLLLSLMRALRQVYQSVKDIDAAMTELQIVTNSTAKQMERAANSIAKSARSIGTGIADLAKSTTVYARLGYGIADAQKLAEKTTIYANVAGVNVSEATTNITGIIKAFNIGAEGLEAVLDQLIWVGNNFPISQAEIGEAMNNAASSLAANGNTLQEAIAIVSAANTTLQNVSKSSTAVRTIAARISASTSELEELGENIDDLETFPNLAKKMRGYGVEITGANGQLLSTYEILGRVAGRWDDLEQNERAAIATMLAGTRQQAAFYSIMQNWGDAQNIVGEAESATGSLMQAQETWLDSIEGKLQKLTATWEDFARKLLESDLIKGGVTILNGFVTVLDWIMGWFPAANVAIGAISFLVLNLLKKGITGGISWGKQVIQNIKNYRELAKTVQTLTTELNTQKLALTANTEAFDKLNIGNGATAESVSALFKENIQDLNAFKTTLENTYGVTGDNAEAVVKWAQEQQKLTVQVDATSASLVKAQKAQSTLMTAVVGGIMGIAGILLTVANNVENTGWKIALTVIAIVGAVVAAIVAGIKIVDTAMKMNVIFAAISLAVSAIIGLISLITSIIPSFNNLKKKAKECKDAWEDTKEELDEVKNKINEVQEAIDKLNSKEIKSLVEEEELERLNQELELLKQQEAVKEEQEAVAKRDAMNSAEKALDKYKSENTIRDGDGNVIKSFDSRVYDALKDYRNSEDREWALKTINEYNDVLAGFDYGLNEKMDSYLADRDKLLDMYTAATKSTVDAWGAIISRTTNKGAVDALKAFADTYSDTSQITGAALEDLAGKTPDVKKLFDYLKTIGMWDGNNWDDLTVLIGNLRTKLVELTAIDIVNDIEAMTDRFDALSDALSDVAKNGILSLGSLQALADKYPSLLNKYFKRDLDGYKLSGDYQGQSDFDILQDMAITSLKEYQDVLENAKKTLAGLTQEDDDYETALKNLATAQDNLNMKEIEWASLLRESAISEETNRLEKMQDALEEQLDIYKELIDIRKDLLKTYQDEVNYQKELAKKQKSVADLQTQLTLAKLDKSAAGQARARELESQLQEAQEELDEYTLERAISDITIALENEYNEYEKFIQEQVELISAQITEIAQTLHGILSGVEGLTNTQFTGSEMYDLYSDLKTKEKAGMSISGDTRTFMDNVASGNYNAADQYYVAAKQASDAYLAPVADTPELDEDHKKAAEMTKIKGAWGQGMAKNNAGDNGEVILNGTTYHVQTATKGDDDGLYRAAYEINKYGDRDIFYYKGNLYGCLDGTILKLEEQDGWGRFWNGVGNNNGWEALKRATGMYHSGGLVGDMSTLKSNEEFAKLLKGEFVSTPQQMDTFMKKTLPAMVSHNSGSDAQIVHNAPLVEIKCGDVDEDTLPKLKSIVDQAVTKIEKNMESALTRTGYKKKF